MESFALFCHLLGAFLLVGGMVVTGVAFEAARRGQTPLQVATLLGLARVGALLVVAGTVLVAAFGLWLVDLGDVGYSDGLGRCRPRALRGHHRARAVGGRRPKHARRLAVAERGRSRREPGAAAAARRSCRAALNYLAALLVVAIVALMVFKPGAG